MKFYEHHSDPLISATRFWWRQVKHIAMAACLFIATILIGIVGFKISGLSYINALLDSTMLMSGMGPVNCDKIGNGGKIFASFYALFCGIVFVAAMGVILAPALHRLLHATLRDRSANHHRSKS